MDKMKKALGLYRSAMDKIRTSGRRKTFTCISLILALVLLVSSTSAWFTVFDKARIQSDTFTMNASTGLRVNEGEAISNVITIENVKLSEASSVDGRNMFFPTSRNLDSSETSKMTFREGTVGDQNALYAYKTFTLMGDSSHTEIYIKSYSITVGDQTFDGGTGIVYDSNGKPVSQVKRQECPVRIAFIEDSADTPKLIDPTALVDEHVHNYDAIKLTDSVGSPFVKKTDAQSFSGYYFLNRPLTTLYGTESKDLTMVVWLECTANSDICDRYADKEISVTVELESNFTGYDIITFIDDTLGDDDTGGHWINPDNTCIVAMSYKDADDVIKTVVMKPTPGTTTQWSAPIPSEITTNISFYRYSLDDDTIYNSWHTHAGVNNELNSTSKGWVEGYTAHNGKLQENRGTSKVYTAVRGNGYGYVEENDSEKEKKRLSPCVGFWDYKTSSGGDDTGGGGGTTTPTDFYINVTLLDDTSSKWIYGNVVNNGCSLYVVFDNGTSSLMTVYGSNYFRTDGIKVSSTAKLKGFELRNRSGQTTNRFYLSSYKSLENSHWYYYKVDYQDKLHTN